MKLNSIILSTLVVLAMSCKAKKLKKSIQEEEVVINQEQVVDKIPNLSDINFIAALEAYQKGEYDTSAKFITDGTEELKKEGDNLNEENTKLLNASIEKINTLAENVKKGDQDLVTLAQAFGNAEMLVSHDYITYTMSTLVEEPVRGSYYFSKALRLLNGAVVMLEGEAKEEAKQIQAESKKLASKIKEGTSGLIEQLDMQTKKIDDFLVRHETELF